MAEKVKCLIIGSGPAGYTAAIYAARANLKPVLIEGMLPGGQLTQTSEVENFPGYPEGVAGFQMMDDMRNQALRFGTDIRNGQVTSVDFSGSVKKIVVDGETEILADSVVISTGASAKYLGLPDETKYAGQGVSACATCDGFFYRKKTVAVVGGGDTACGDVVYLSGICKQVYLLVRKTYLRASSIMQDRVMQLPNVKVLFEHEVEGLYGENGVEGANLLIKRGQADERHEKLAIDGLFLAIGHHPNSDLFKGILDLDENGYIKTLPNTQKTNVEGVYAAGDVADPVYQQAIVAAASGCKAAMELIKYLTEK
ncbi:MAG: thioredoxin-disulfide reductase [Paludibacteraceae bacterium]|nr:thioredoxin-disulfide reductase [Paludibacteraceae bacterium]